MKPFAILLLTASVALPADFYTGQAARLLIGQETFTSQASNLDPNTLGGVGGLALANNTLFVADSNRVSASPINHRVLMYRNVSGTIAYAVNGEIPQIPGKRCPACRGTAELVLGQLNFATNDLKLIPTSASMRQPNAVASDGVRLAISDTDNNRILIWNSIPTQNNQAADLVLGQVNFTTSRPPNPPTASSLRGPQGLWIQGGRLMVADTGNNRVLIWNTFPTANNKAADLVLGAADFTSRIELDLTVTRIDPKAENMLNPVSVTSDGQRVFVADLGFNRVLIWNTTPTRNTQPADLVLGQPDFVSATANNSDKLCPAFGKVDNKDVFPLLCGATIEFPRFVLSDGRKLFISDGGNDRVLVYNSLPVRNGQKADVILGQIAETVNRASDSAYPLLRASSDQIRTPMALAFDGANLYVADPYNRRVMVFSTHDQPIPYTGVRNAASLDVFATATVAISGTLRENDEITITIGDGGSIKNDYKYKLIKDERVPNVLQKMIALINEKPDPLVTARVVPDLSTILLTARQGGEAGNTVTVATATSPTDATIVLTTGGATLNGGTNAAEVAPGTVISLLGDDLAEVTAAAPANAEQLPLELGNVQLYLDGVLAPLFLVSPTRINAQLPWEFSDRSSVNAYVRLRRRDGRVTTTMPIAVPIISQNPGLFAVEGSDPRTGITQHFSSRATGTISVDGSVKAGDIATITVDGRNYVYTVKDTDGLDSIRDSLIALVNQDEKVEAFPAGVFTRIRLRARTPGEAGNGLVYSAKTNDGAQVILTATTPALCCANTEGAPITVANPALPGETIIVFGTGLGRLKQSAAQDAAKTGAVYRGPALNEVGQFVSSLAGAKTANVLYAGLRPGSIGVYEIHLELNSDLPTNSATQLTIAQDIYVSNVITFALRNPGQVEVVP